MLSRLPIKSAFTRLGPEIRLRHPNSVKAHFQIGSDAGRGADAMGTGVVTEKGQILLDVNMETRLGSSKNRLPYS